MSSSLDEYKRGLSPEFLNDLNAADGMLNPLLEHLKKDTDLILCIRATSINIYYRGGNILRLKRQGNCYSAAIYDSIEKRYFEKYPNGINPLLPKLIAESKDIIMWVNAFPEIKQVMGGDNEREVQQRIVKENHVSGLATGSDYFITDVEVKSRADKKKMDMTAISGFNGAKNGQCNFRPAFIELKYGKNSLEDTSGMVAHLNSMVNLVRNKDCYQVVTESMEKQFKQLCALGLTHSDMQKWSDLKLNPEHPEIIFIIAGDQASGQTLDRILAKPEFVEAANAKDFDLRFYMPTGDDYALPQGCMVTLEELHKLIKE